MATTLTKPVLLDETGQEIVTKLDNIKDAIGASGDFIPLLIKVVTPPTKTLYIAGETLDLSGIVVNLVSSTGVQIDVTSACTFTPSNGTPLTTSDTSVSISYLYQQDNLTFTTLQALSIDTIQSISITTTPTTVDYTPGEALDLTGIVVKATTGSGSQIDVTSQCVFSPADGAILATTDTEVTATLSVGGDSYTASTPISVSYPIYGVEWDGSANSAFTRMDAAVGFVDPVPYYAGMSETPSSPFDDIMPWSGMQIVEDNNAGTLVSIPKFYYKLSQNGEGIKVQISESMRDGFHISPAHMDRGDGNGERDIVYVGRHHCAATYKSASGVSPKNNITRATARTSIHNLGADIWQWDFPMLTTIWLLYLVEFADWYSRAKIGYGGGNGSSIENMGYTDSMPYHTGTMKTSKTTYGSSTQYRHIEGLWENVMDYIDGANGNMGIILNPSEFDDYSEGIKIAQVIVGSGNDFSKKAFVSDVNGLFPLIYHEVSGGSDSTYICNGWNTSSQNVAVVAGGRYNYQNQQNYGLFCIGNSNINSYAAWFGCRLMKLPNNS